MISKSHRLSRLEVESLKQASQTKRGDGFTILFSPAHTQKYGAIITKKVSSKANARNHLKRILFESLRNTPPKPNGHYLIIPHPSITNKTNQQIVKSLQQTCAQIDSDK